MDTKTLPTYTTGLTAYRNSGGLMQGRTHGELLAHIDAHPGDVTLILGVMRPGYLGREMVTEDDLRRWVAEDESAAEWGAIEDGEKYAADNGLLR